MKTETMQCENLWSEQNTRSTREDPVDAPAGVISRRDFFLSTIAVISAQFRKDRRRSAA